MITDTRFRIKKEIESKGPQRPAELVRAIGISPQALHRHLKAMVEQGVLVIQGKPPKTWYALAGVADFSNAFKWIEKKTVQESPRDRVCETRDVLMARLGSLKNLIREGLSASELPLLIATVGEIGNNSFDHNLGQWRDVPGCWFEVQATGNHLWVCLADRGQGIYRSLSKANVDIKSEQVALETAFEKFVSGRSPEKRGNGLKFVKQTILGECDRGIACISGSGAIQYGSWGRECEVVLRNRFSKVQGTITLMAWRLG